MIWVTMDMYSALAKSGILMAKKVPMSTFLFGRFSFLFVVMSFFSPGFHPRMLKEVATGWVIAHILSFLNISIAALFTYGAIISTMQLPSVLP